MVNRREKKFVGELLKEKSDRREQAETEVCPGVMVDSVNEGCLRLRGGEKEINHYTYCKYVTDSTCP